MDASRVAKSRLLAPHTLRQLEQDGQIDALQRRDAGGGGPSDRGVETGGAAHLSLIHI